MAKTKTEKEGLEKLLEELNKKYGSGTIMDGSKIVNTIESINSGSLTLDIATGINGLPLGKLIEMQGPESSGKSTLTLHFIAEFQKAGKKCVLVDGEASFDKKYATALGVKVDNLLYVQPPSQEDAYNVIQKLIESDEIDLIVIDSHTSLMPQAVIDNEVGQATIGLQARINSVALGKIHPLLAKYNCTMVAISQLRTAIGGYGDPNVSTGGMGYKFYSDMRFKVSKKVEKDKEQNKTVVEIIKNKCGKPFGKSEFTIQWGEGIDRQQELIDLAVEYDLLKLGGAGWYTINEDTKIQGDIKLKEFLNDNEEYAKELEAKVMEKIDV
jgi:recombination protein RecA